MTIDQKIALFKSVKVAYENRLAKLQTSVGSGSGIGGGLMAELQEWSNKLNSAINATKEKYQSYIESNSKADYEAYIVAYSIAQDLRGKCDSLRATIQNCQNQMSKIKNWIRKTEKIIQALTTEKEKQEEQEDDNGSSNQS